MLPGAPGETCPRPPPRLLAPPGPPAESKARPPIPLTPVSGPESVDMGAAVPVAVSENWLMSLLRPLPTHTAGCGVGLTVMVSDLCTSCGVGDESTTCTLNVTVPAAVGMPLITPVLDSDSPAGNGPELTDHANGALPATACRVAE